MEKELTRYADELASASKQASKQADDSCVTCEEERKRLLQDGRCNNQNVRYNCKLRNSEVLQGHSCGRRQCSTGIIQIGNLSKKTQSRSVYSVCGICPTLCSGMDHGNTVPYILES